MSSGKLALSSEAVEDTLRKITLEVSALHDEAKKESDKVRMFAQNSGLRFVTKISQGVDAIVELGNQTVEAVGVMKTAFAEYDAEMSSFSDSAHGLDY